MNDATMEGLQCHPKGNTAGRKGQDRKGPRERQLSAPGLGGRKVWGKREGYYEGGRTSADPSNPSQACLLGLGEGGSRRLPLMASWPTCLCSDQPLGWVLCPSQAACLPLFFVLNKAKEASAFLFMPPGRLAHYRACLLEEISSSVSGRSVVGNVQRRHAPWARPRLDWLRRCSSCFLFYF